MNISGKVIVRAAVVGEELLGAAIHVVLRVRGRHHPMILPFIGHGTTRQVRIGARVVRGRSDVQGPAVGVPQAPFPTVRSRRAVLRSSIARFLTVEVPRAVVTVSLPNGPVQVRADHDGYLDAVLDVAGLAPGWHEIVLSLADGTSSRAPVLVVDPQSRIGLVSDVDDTILETGLSRGLEFLRATLLTEVHERTPLPGAAALYRALVAAPGPPRPVFYLSTSPWNLHGMLLEFVALRRFPLGPMLLTDWGPARGSAPHPDVHRGLFRIGAQEHKVGMVRRLLTEHPLLRLVLIGDSGQLDPEIYATLAREQPDRIIAVYIRRTPTTGARRAAELAAIAAGVTAAGVPMLVVGDSGQIADHAASLGLLDPAATAEVWAGG